MKCEELLAMLNECVEGTIDDPVRAACEEHLAGCDPCQVIVDNVRQTILLFREGQPDELPGPLRHRLHAALRARWREKHPAG